MTGQGASRVNVTRAKSRGLNIAAAGLTVGSMLGITERGPIGEYALVTSFEDYKAIFGDFTANAKDLPLAVKAAFEEADQGKGLKLLLVGRVVHTTVVGDPTAKTSAAGTLVLQTAAVAASAAHSDGTAVAPYDLEPGDTLIVTIDAGGPTTATFNATAATRETTNSSASPYALANNDVLTVKIDGGIVQTITFVTANFVTIGTATAPEVAAVINAQLVGGKATVTSSTKVSITSDKRGTGSHVEVTGGTANAAGKLNFSVAVANGTGNVANIDAVTSAEVKSVVEAAVSGCVVSNSGGKQIITSNTTGSSSHVLVGASSTADDELGFDNATHNGSSGAAVNTLQIDGKTDGTYANTLQPRVSAASSGVATEFNLALVDGGVIVESWFNLSMDPLSARYAPDVINKGTAGQRASNLIKATDLAANLIPASGTFGPLTGGADGLGSLADTDFTGGMTSNGATGLRIFDKAQRLDLLAVPGRATSAVHNGAITYCEVNRAGRCYFIADPPAGQTYQQIITYVSSTALLQELSEIADIQWPRVAYDNPDASVYGSDATVFGPPSGAKMGICARVDAAKVGGAFTHPAGIENGFSRTIRDVESDDVNDEIKRGLVFDARINPIRVQKGKPIYLDGARTLKSTGAFPTVGESRGVMFTQNQIAEALDDRRHRNITPRLLGEEKNAIDVFLKQLTVAECFASTKPSEAYFVDFGAALNTAATAEAAETNGRYGMATTKPNEFINVEAVPFTPGQVAALAGV